MLQELLIRLSKTGETDFVLPFCFLATVYLLAKVRKAKFWKVFLVCGGFVLGAYMLDAVCGRLAENYLSKYYGIMPSDMADGVDAPTAHGARPPTLSERCSSNSQESNEKNLREFIRVITSQGVSPAQLRSSLANGLAAESPEHELRESIACMNMLIDEAIEMLGGGAAVAEVQAKQAAETMARRQARTEVIQGISDRALRSLERDIAGELRRAEQESRRRLREKQMEAVSLKKSADDG